MSANAKRYFLAKQGQTYGPYDEEEIGTLREAGDYQRYSWFWDPAQPRWQPIDPPPAPPSLKETPKPERSRTTEPSERPRTVVTVETVAEGQLSAFSVLCYDQVTVLAGTLRNVTEAGCEFMTSDGGTSPVFSQKNKVLMNILDGRTGRTMSVSARLGRAARKDGRWHYRIFWKRCPEIIKENPNGEQDTSSTVSNPIAG